MAEETHAIKVGYSELQKFFVYCWAAERKFGPGRPVTLNFWYYKGYSKKEGDLVPNKKRTQPNMHRNSGVDEVFSSILRCGYTSELSHEPSHNPNVRWFVYIANIWANLQAGNILKLAQVCNTSHHAELSLLANGDSANNLRHMLRTWSCAAQTLFDHYRSIKVSTI